MIRCLIVLLFWLATLGTIEIDIAWRDGWNIELHSWLTYVIRKHKESKDAARGPKEGT